MTNMPIDKPTAVHIVRTVRGLVGRAPFNMWLRVGFMVLYGGPEFSSAVLRKNFAQNLRSALDGRKVEVLPAQFAGITCVTVNYYPPKAKMPMVSAELDLTQQKDPLDLPIGMTYYGPKWVNLKDIDCALIGGTRGMGKTNLLHCWIQAGIHGNRMKLYIHDGKEQSEFGPYAASSNVVTSMNLTEILDIVDQVVSMRRQNFVAGGFHSIFEATSGGYDCPPLVLIVDEVANIDDNQKSKISYLLRTCRAYGVFVVLATQRTGTYEVPADIKTNLGTRIAFFMPTVHDYNTILGPGHNVSLRHHPGRLHTIIGGRQIDAQAFLATPPSPLLQTSTFVSNESGKQKTVEFVQPTGIYLNLLKKACESGDPEFRITQKLIQEWMPSISQWQAKKYLDYMGERGWVVKNSKLNNSNVVRDYVREFIIENANL